MVCSVHQKKIPPGIFLCVNKSTFLRGYPVLLPAQKWLKGVLCDDNRWGWWWQRHHSSGHSQLAEAGMDSCGLGHVQEDFWACPTIKCAPAGQTKSLFLLLLFLLSNSFQTHHNLWRFLLFFLNFILSHINLMSFLQLLPEPTLNSWRCLRMQLCGFIFDGISYQQCQGDILGDIFNRSCLVSRFVFFFGLAQGSTNPSVVSKQSSENVQNCGCKKS